MLSIYILKKIMSDISMNKTKPQQIQLSQNHRKYCISRQFSMSWFSGFLFRG